MIDYGRFPPDSYMRKFNRVLASPNKDIFLAVNFQAALFFITDNGEREQILKVGGNTTEHYVKREEARIEVVKWSPDGTKVGVIFRSDKPKHSLVIFDVSSLSKGGQDVTIFAEIFYREHGMGIRDFIWDASGQYISLIKYHEPKIWIWKVGQNESKSSTIYPMNIVGFEEPTSNSFWQKNGQIKFLNSFDVHHTISCGCISWSSNNRFICTGNRKGALEIFDLSNGTFYFLQTPNNETDKSNLVRLIKWSTNNQVLFTVSTEFGSILNVWDISNLDNPEIIHQIQNNSLIRELRINEQRNECLIVDNLGVFKIYDLSSSEKTFETASDMNIKDVLFEYNEVIWINDHAAIGRFPVPNNSLL